MMIRMYLVFVWIYGQVEIKINLQMIKQVVKEKWGDFVLFEKDLRLVLTSFK